MNEMNSHTYVAGEDDGRLARVARYFGLESARRRLGNVRETAASMLQSDLLEAARMHSVGALGQDERVDKHGTLHIITMETRPRHRKVVSADDAASYNNLQDLFRQGSVTSEESDEDGSDEEEIYIKDTIEGGSLTAAVFGIVKGTIGPAILFLPRGFELSGYAVAIPSMIVATASYLYSANRLLECWKVEKRKLERIDEIRELLVPSLPGTPKRYGSFSSLGSKTETAATILTYPELARRAFGNASFVVRFGIACMQFGVCLTYLIFVPQNLVESTKNLFGVEVDELVFLVTMILIEIPLSWIQDIRKLTTTNILATCLIAYGLASCLAIAFSTTIPDEEPKSILSKIAELPPVNETWFLFIGTSFFVFEGSITLVVPLQEAVFHKEDKERFPAVNQAVTSWIVIFYIFFAITCWASFGDSIRTALTASLPEGNFSTSIQFAYSLAVIFTFPLQAFPALEVIFHPSPSPSTSSPLFSDKKESMSVLERNIWASIIICLLGAVAFLAMDYLGNVVSLLGSLVGIPIALIYPPLMHNRLVKDSSKTTRIMNISVAAIGVFAMGATSFTTLVSWDKGAEG